MVGEGNVSKKATVLMMDDEVEHVSKTTLCRESEGGERGDKWEGEEETVDTEVYGNTDSSKMTWRVTKNLLVRREKHISPYIDLHILKNASGSFRLKFVSVVRLE